MEKKYTIFDDKTSLLLNGFFCMIHICYLLLFWYFKVYIMLFFNVFSVIFYLVGFSFVNKNQLFYFYCICVEILLHMFLATICIGWLAGFQLYYFSLIQAVYFVNYNIAKTTFHKKVNTLLIEIICVVLLLANYFFSVLVGSIYKVEPAIVVWIILFANIVVFCAFYIYHMSSYDKYLFTTQKHINNMAKKDWLTGLDNRWNFMNSLEKNMQSKSVAIVDIDDFKKINDTFGHCAGDYILQKIAKHIERTAPVSGRWGGEEFILCIWGEDSYHLLCERVQHLVQEMKGLKFYYNDHEINVTLTVGVAQKKEEEALEKTIDRADSYLYYGKQNGKNQMVTKQLMESKVQ